MSKRSDLPRCAACGRLLPVYEYAPAIEFGGDPMRAPRGRNGDGVVCGITCGYRLAMRIVEQVPGILATLTPQHPEPRSHEFEQNRRTIASIEGLDKIVKLSTLSAQDSEAAAEIRLGLEQLIERSRP